MGRQMPRQRIQFNRRLEENTEELLNNAENQVAALSQYTEFVKQKKYEKAEEHHKEVDTLESDKEKVRELFNKNTQK